MMSSSPDENPQASIIPPEADGIKPWRRVAHAAYGVSIFAALEILDPGKWTAVACLMAVLVAQVSFDWLRLRHTALNRWFFRAFRYLASPRETHAPVSSTWYTAGVLLAVAALPRGPASSGILLLAVADPVASIVGRLWGRRRFLGGSMEGSAAFAVVAMAVLWTRYPPLVAVTGALLSTLAERLAWPLDDNLVLPIAAGSGVWLLGTLL